MLDHKLYFTYKYEQLLPNQNIELNLCQIAWYYIAQ